jgi:hypothetical protein
MNFPSFIISAIAAFAQGAAGALTLWQVAPQLAQVSCQEYYAGIGPGWRGCFLCFGSIPQARQRIGILLVVYDMLTSSLERGPLKSPVILAYGIRMSGSKGRQMRETSKAQVVRRKMRWLMNC